MQQHHLIPALLLAACSGADPEKMAAEGGENANTFVLHSRHQDSETGEVLESVLNWEPHSTAIVVVDMWDDHWCKGAAARVEELAGPMNEMLTTLRDRGAFIVHAPSSVVEAHADSMARMRATSARFAETPIPLSTEERWGTAWCWPDEDREGELPIDDSDMGCDCEVECEIRDAWTRQNPRVEIHDFDAVTDDGQELYNLLAERQIDNVLIAGVHLNMCVLGRPVGIRQLVSLGKNVVLVRDMTDTMYDPRQAPNVSHFEGTDLVVGHVERWWCPTVSSEDLTGGPAFRFAADSRE